MATTLGLIKADVSSFTLAVTSITMALIPSLSLVARRLEPRFRCQRQPTRSLPSPSGGTAHAIVIGHGRVGQVVGQMLIGTASVISR